MAPAVSSVGTLHFDWAQYKRQPFDTAQDNAQGRPGEETQARRLLVRCVDIKEHEFAPTQADEFLLLDLREPENCKAALTLHFDQAQYKHFDQAQYKRQALHFDWAQYKRQAQDIAQDDAQDRFHELTENKAAFWG